jgi:hypothetical protein
MPQTYREPLVLFYREGQSVERVAQALELSEDAVKQRLSRGRKLLQEEVTQFVEGALRRSSPGRTFTIGVLSALPLAVGVSSASAGVLAATAAKGSATAKAAGFGAVLGSILGPFMGLLGPFLGYRLSMHTAESAAERGFIRKFYGWLAVGIIGFVVATNGVIHWHKQTAHPDARLFIISILGLSIAYVLGIIVLMRWFHVRERTLAAQGSNRAPVRPAFEYRSSRRLLDLPLVHIRLGGSLSERQRAVKAWIAVGDCAIGGLFAFGGMATAPIAIGGMAVGLVSFGGFALGGIAFGGFSLGAFAIGGQAIGWEAIGACAVAWKAAVGGVAVAREFALGNPAYAAQAANDIADAFVRNSAFFQIVFKVMRYGMWINLVWILPMLGWWKAVASQRRKQMLAAATPPAGGAL